MPSHESPAGPGNGDVLARAFEFSGIPALAGRFVPVGKVRDLYRRVRLSSDGFRLENLLSEMRITLRADAEDVSRVPASGPVVVVANHPFGVLDGAALAALLLRVRPDVKVMTNVLLADVPELKPHCIFVDPFESNRSRHSNHSALREALDWLKQGSMLAVFPAGEVSHWQFPQGEIADPKWSDIAVRLIRRTGASALPVYFCGHNSAGFQLFGMIHPRLRTAFLLQEFLRQAGSTVEVRIGSELDAESITAIAGDREAVEYLRWRTYLLAKRIKKETSSRAAMRPNILLRNPKNIAPPVAAELLAAEVDVLLHRRLAESGDYALYSVEAREAPQLLQELGRLREATFRRAGEGTGRGLDLDRFDRYYWHLLLWNRAKRELVGAYRAGSTSEILPRYGVSGLYTSTLFRYDERVFDKIGPALELGRSFIRPEYQRQYAPLLLLWKGIARLVSMHPDLPVLFGAVSISNDYNRASREMIYRFFESQMKDDELSGMIVPRRPFRPGRLRPWDCRAMNAALHDIEDLSQPITDVEADGKGLPILLRQYAKIGGRLLGFNVDRKFSNVLDGLIVVDLRQTGAAVLERYMGREGATRFREHHQG